MYKVVGSEEFIDEIRKLDECVKKIRLSNIEVDKKGYSITYNFICDKTVGEDIRNKVLEMAEKITSPVFTCVQINIKKIVSNDQLVNSEIYKYLNANYPSISLFLKPTDINSTVFGDLVKYTLRLTKDGIEYVTKNVVILKLNEYLAKKFCSDFAGNTEEKEAEETVSLLNEEVYESQLQKIEHRTIKVEEVYIIDDVSMGSLATYIEDATAGELTVCGRIVEITEKQTKTGKPMFLIKIDDTTGVLKGLYFSKKNTVDKIRELKQDDEIIARGKMGEYKGNPSFTFERINKCTFPKNFVKKDKYKKKAPFEYKLIFPTPAEIIKVKSVFEKEEVLPEEILKNEFVVFDTETTGTDIKQDEITEIGAVRIKGGKIVEEFTSLIKPDCPIPQGIVDITGITDDLVKDAPKISSVIPDFMKFIDGAILVGHNVLFDLGLVKKFAGAEDYDVNNKYMDTLELARTYLPQLKNHKLNTLAEYFKVVFHHHRALADAYATADIFMELMKIKAQKG